MGDRLGIPGAVDFSIFLLDLKELYAAHFNTYYIGCCGLGILYNTKGRPSEALNLPDNICTLISIIPWLLAGVRFCLLF